ncbi:MAG: hypothetical protein ACK56I_09580 [bacterium]
MQPRDQQTVHQPQPPSRQQHQQNSHGDGCALAASKQHCGGTAAILAARVPRQPQRGRAVPARDRCDLLRRHSPVRKKQLQLIPGPRRRQQRQLQRQPVIRHG